jgi:hypothetical protein
MPAALLSLPGESSLPPSAFGLGWAQGSLRSRWTESCGGLVFQRRRVRVLSRQKSAP